MALFGRSERISDDYMPTRTTAAVYSVSAVDHKWYIQDLASADALISAEIPETEGILAILLYSRSEFLAVTPRRIILFTMKKVKRELPLRDLQRVVVTQRENTSNIYFECQKPFFAQWANRNADLGPARSFANEVDSARKGVVDD